MCALPGAHKKARSEERAMVVKAGLEPARRLRHKILNLACLPIPPLDQLWLRFLTEKLIMIGPEETRSTQISKNILFKKKAVHVLVSESDFP